jgi:hypothetical protein
MINQERGVTEGQSPNAGDALPDRHEEPYTGGNTALAGYKLPQSIDFVTALTRNRSGKSSGSCVRRSGRGARAG